MNKQLLILTTLVLFPGCAKRNVLDLGEFKPYVNRFEELSRAYGVPVKVENLIMRKGEPDLVAEDTLGICIRGETPEIVIDSDFWGQADETDREIVVMHELGHCVLNRDHDDREVDGRKRSVMNARVPDAKDYDRFYNAYTRELFTGKFE